MLTLVFMVIGVLLIVLQTSVFHMLPGSSGRPDMIFLLIAFAAYRFAWLPGILLAFAIGWIFDVLVGVNLGIYPLIALFEFCCLKLVAMNSPVKSAAYEIPLVGLGYFLMRMFVFFFSSLEDVLPEWSWGEVIRETLLLVLAAIPCFLLFNSLYEYLVERAKRAKPARRQTVRRR